MTPKRAKNRSLAAEVRRLVGELVRQILAIEEADAQSRVRRALEGFGQNAVTPAVDVSRDGELVRRCIERAKAFIEARYAEPLNLDIIATGAGITKFHLARIFRERMGVPPYRYLTKVRVPRRGAAREWPSAAGGGEVRRIL